MKFDLRFDNSYNVYLDDNISICTNGVRNIFGIFSLCGIDLILRLKNPKQKGFQKCYISNTFELVINGKFYSVTGRTTSFIVKNNLKNKLIWIKAVEKYEN